MTDTPGSSRPSRNSSEAPPPVEIQLILSGLPPDPGMTIRTDESQEDTYLAEVPKK